MGWMPAMREPATPRPKRAKRKSRSTANPREGSRRARRAASATFSRAPRGILAQMRQLPLPGLVLRFAAVATIAPLAYAVIGAGCGPDTAVVWFCLNPITGKLDNAHYDETHYVNGVFDPCHCYDPCGPEKSCPIVVDAGEPRLGCDEGADAGGT